MKNVLLLTMSTFPERSKVQGQYELQKNYYEFEDDENTILVEGHIQMEPIPKMLIEKLRLEEQSQILDSIIVLASKEAKDKKKVICLEADNSVQEISPCTLFENKIKELSKNTDIKIINANDDNMYDALKDVIVYLEEIEEFVLYQDIHGGKRENQLLTDAIINIVRNSDTLFKSAKIGNSYSVSGGSSDKNKRSIINDVTDKTEVFDLVAGIGEFVNYGRSKSLKKFFNEKYQDFVDALNAVSDSLQLCCMDVFARNLEILKNQIENIKGETAADIVLTRETVHADYKDLFKETDNVILQLKWCIKHEFYQQALTIIESNVPEFLFREKIIKFDFTNCDGKEDSVERSTDFDEKDIQIYKIVEKKTNEKKKIYEEIIINEEMKISDFVDSCKNNWVERVNYLFENCLKILDARNRDNYKCDLVLPDNKDGYIRRNPCYYTKYEKKCKLPDADYYNRYKCKTNNNGDDDKKEDKFARIYLHLNKNEDKDRENFNRFCQIHFMLKNQRNLTNHAKQADSSDLINERADLERIKVAIEAYIELLEMLFSEKTCS